MPHSVLSSADSLEALSWLVVNEAEAPIFNLHVAFDDEVEAVLAQLPVGLKLLAEAQDFHAQVGRLVLSATDQGPVALLGLGARSAYHPAIFRSVPQRLTPGAWQVVGSVVQTPEIGLYWRLGAYAFTAYKPTAQKPAAILVLSSEDEPEAESLALSRANYLVKDLVNTPAEDMGPQHLEAAAYDLSEEFEAGLLVTTGEDLLDARYPALHAVGRAAAKGREPRVIELHWNADKTDLPLVALVGKGVVFDSGGLDIKPSAGMRNMKKDMGGAAHALGLAQVIMSQNLPVRLVVLIGAVENAISGKAFRPGDILSSRKGLSIEVGNTDAEGRLVLADLLTRAEEWSPDLTLDFATLTGAARIALGPEVVPFYTGNDRLAEALAAAAHKTHDPVWRMPLWAPYQEALEGEISDVKNDPDGWAQGGSVLAALFLQRFAPAMGDWAHFDLFAWNPRNRPGYPAGGECQSLRAVYEMLKNRY